MLRPFFWILRWLLASALLGYAAALLGTLMTSSSLLSDGELQLVRHPVFWAFLAGLGGRWALSTLRSGDPLELLDTLEHELTHAVAGWLTFSPPVSLKATLRHGGEVELKHSNPVAVLAPYCLPLYATLVALLSRAIVPEWSEIARLGVGVLLGSFCWRLSRELHFGQSDFSEFGILYSVVSIVAAMPLCVLGILNLAGVTAVPWGAAMETCWRWLEAAAATNSFGPPRQAAGSLAQPDIGC